MKMKKFINAPETITDEEVVGLGVGYPDIVAVGGPLVITTASTNGHRTSLMWTAIW